MKQMMAMMLLFGSDNWEFSTGIKPSSSLPDLEKGHLIESEDVRSQQKVQMLEDLKTEALMCEWGLIIMVLEIQCMFYPKSLYHYLLWQKG